jgi:hypothetical protein
MGMSESNQPGVGAKRLPWEIVPQKHFPSLVAVLRSRVREKVASGRMRVVRGKSFFDAERAGVRSRKIDGEST